MKILYLSQYFPPEVGATQTRAYEMARYLAAQGHQVTMLTEVPNHPSGIIPAEYRRTVADFSTLEGIRVVRLWVLASPKKSFLRRISFYLSYTAMATWASLFLRGKYDVIVATSPPLFVGLAGVLVSYLKRTKLVFEVRDIWPESAVILGELNNPRAIKLSEAIEQWCYRRARQIVVVTEGIRQRLIARGLSAKKLHLIMNGANVSQFQPQPEQAAVLRHKLGLEGKFVVLYAGIHGIAQGMETLVEVARLLRDESSIHFLFVGEGPKKEETTALVRALALPNVTLVGERPREQMAAYLSLADSSLVPLKKVALFEGALPSKMFEALACSTPVILSVGGEATRVLGEMQAGIAVEPESAAQIVEAIRWLQAHPNEARLMGARGRAAVTAHYSRQAQAAELTSLLEQVVAER